VEPGTTPEVRIWAEQKGKRVEISVKDNGIGIAKEHQQRIFWIFERLGPALNHSGTGMGLALVQKGMSRLGGSVRVESEPGMGSRFVLELPKGPPEGPGYTESHELWEMDAGKPKESLMRPSRTILLAEDDDNDFLLMKSAFEKIGAEEVFRRVQNGEEAIRYLKGENAYHDGQRYPSVLVRTWHLKLKAREREVAKRPEV